MSYILDALKKAAEQRNVPAPEVRRLLAPSPVATVWPARHITLGAAAFGAIAMAGVVWLWWGPPEPVPPTVAAVSATANPETRTAPTPPIAPSPAAPPTRIPPSSATTAPAPTLSPATSASATPPTTLPAEKPFVTARPVAPAPQAPTAPPPASPPISQPPAVAARPVTPTPPSIDPRARPPRPSENPMADLMPAPLRAPGSQPPASRPAPPPAVASAPPSATTPSGLQRGSLRIEVIVYSEERPKRLAFINGRKYVEGDAVGSGMVLEEIQPNAVVINEDGRRVTLRP